jgi:lysophospholipase L1-like esterase
MVRGMQTYNAALAEIATARGVPFADFEAAVPKTGEFFSDDVHMRKAGNERVAKAAADLIDGKGWIK